MNIDKFDEKGFCYCCRIFIDKATEKEPQRENTNTTDSITTKINITTQVHFRLLCALMYIDRAK